MERVTGIGGYFLRASDPEAMTTWYRDVFGVDFGDHGLWQQPEGPTVIGFFEADTDYFGTRPEGQDRQQTMLNFRVADLDAMIAQLRVAGAEVDDQTQQMDGIGRFGWVTDPEGNRIELWEPEEQG
ncbi:VOC family protein [Brevibacterium pigmentatum]|nr:VOC family protein [Brevibacterium pigmentatum]